MMYVLSYRYRRQLEFSQLSTLNQNTIEPAMVYFHTVGMLLGAIYGFVLTLSLILWALIGLVTGLLLVFLARCLREEKAQAEGGSKSKGTGGFNQRRVVGWRKGGHPLSFQAVEDVRKHLEDITFQYWFHGILFTWQWWLLVVLAILPWVLCLFLCDKKRVLEIGLYATVIAIICTCLDLMGFNLKLWGYPTHLVWFLVPPIIPIDLCILPVEHMLIYQYCPRWPRFVMVLVIAALLNSFVAEPFFVWAGIYKLYMWQYIYSMPIYIAKGIVAKLLLQGLMRTQARARTRARA